MLLLDLAEQVQAAVREKVHAQSWQVFWHIAVDGWTTRETADALNMSYLAAHAAHKRVVDRLAKEGDRRLAELMSSNTDTRPVATMTNCPSEATLRLIGTEAVGEATFAGLEGHVEQCPDCQKVLEAAMKAVPQATHPAPARNTPPTLPGLVIERELGRGGASVVYLAWEPALNRHVAVKLFPRNSLVDPHTREHWLGEARALSRVPHDHVVAIHRVDETEEWLWLVIEYVSGGTLKDRLTEPLPPRDAARLTETIARAVGYFHTRGVCSPRSETVEHPARRRAGSPLGNRLPQDFRFRHRPPRRRARHDRDRRATAPRGLRPTWPPSKWPPFPARSVPPPISMPWAHSCTTC